MKRIVLLIILLCRLTLLIKRLGNHLLVYFKSPFRWKTEHRRIRYEFLYRKYS